MSLGQWFWGGLTLACLIWYGSVTLYVAFRGLADIQSMLKKLARREDAGKRNNIAEP